MIPPMRGKHTPEQGLGGSPTESGELARQLSDSSLPYRDPLARIDWSALSADDWWLPPEMLSLHGVAAFESLPEARRRALSVAEFVHFAQGGLWLEALFMERLAAGPKLTGDNAARRIYQLHELREEAGHSLMFMEAIHRSTLAVGNAAWSRLWFTRAVARHVPFDSPLFWSAVLLGEEVADRFSRALRGSAEEINPAIHQLVSIHLMDEARHIAHARDILGRCMARLPAWRRVPLQRLSAMLFARFARIFYYPPGQTYEMAGLSGGAQWRRRALANPRRHAFVADQLRSIRKLARDIGILP